jgi:hypothetical protein
MRQLAIWALVLGVAAGGTIVYFTSLRRSRLHDAILLNRAQSLQSQARALEDSAAAMGNRGGWLGAERRAEQIGRLEEQAAELMNQADFLRRTKPLPTGRISQEMLLRAQALSDSAATIREELLDARGSVSVSQQRSIDKLNQQSRELKLRAQLLGSRGSSTAQQLEMYNSCTLIYGEGAAACRQLRGEVTLPPRP